MHSKQYAATALICLMALAFGAYDAPASSRCDIRLVNALGEPIHTVTIRYDTPYGEPRTNVSDVSLPPDGEYRLGIQGVTLPTRITLVLPLTAYVFTDLAGLHPEASMTLSVSNVNGVPLLRRVGGGQAGEVRGLQRNYLTPRNRPNAVDRDFLSDATTLDEIRELVSETVEDAHGEFGKLREIAIEGGPIPDYAAAKQRCPELIAEWNATNGKEARWTGEWFETEPGKASVCNAITGTDTLGNTLFAENEDRGETLIFPVFWKDWAGYTTARWFNKDNPKEGVVLTIKIPLPENDIPDMLDELLSDLRVDGYRPVTFRLEPTGDGEEVERNFMESDGDKYDDQEAIQEHLTAVFKNGNLDQAVIGWVREEAFNKKRAGGELGATSAVAVLIKNGQLTAVFVPDGSMLMP